MKTFLIESKNSKYIVNNESIESAKIKFASIYPSIKIKNITEILSEFIFEIL